MRSCILAFLLCLGFSSAALAQDWATAMFDHTSHDFGVVARGAKVQHRFKLENIYLEDAHIASVHSSCNCTIPEFTKDTLKTYETAEIIANIDTRTFLGRKEATIRVVFDKPFPAEVQLHVYTYIRSDVVVEPGEVQFGTITQGTSARKKVSVIYAGRGDWQILDIQGTQPYLQAKALETGRADGRVTYDLWVDVKPEAPTGYLKDVLMLVTNDRNPAATKVPVAVEGLVIGAVSVQPSPLTFGLLQTDQTATKQLVVRAKTPFRITGATSEDKRLRFDVPRDNKAKPVQLLPVTVIAGGPAGPLSNTIQIQTDMEGGKALEVKVEGMIVGKDAVPTRQPARSGNPQASGSQRVEGWKPVMP